MQQKINVWLDCDPGLDDTLAIILTGLHSDLNFVGVSTSAGNTSLDNTTRNALDILHNIGRSQVKVIRGSNELISGEMEFAEHVHGANGLGGVEVSKSTQQAITQKSFQTIAEMILACKDKVIWANTGSLTNLCILLRDYPKVKENIQKIIIMGGAVGKGNMTPAAEFNIYFDPVAAQKVFELKQDIPLLMIPLELTHQVLVPEQFFQYLQEKEKDYPFAKALYEMMKSFREVCKMVNRQEYPPAHDPCVIYHILRPQQIKFQKAIIKVDVHPSSYGRTNCYFYDIKNPMTQINSIDSVGLHIADTDKFWQLFMSLLDKLFIKKQ